MGNGRDLLTEVIKVSLDLISWPNWSPLKTSSCLKSGFQHWEKKVGDRGRSSRHLTIHCVDVCVIPVSLSRIFPLTINPVYI